MNSNQEEEAPRVSRVQPAMKKAAQWEVTDADELVQETRKTEKNSISSEQVVSVLKGVRGNLIGTTKNIVTEGRSQYVHSYHGFKFHVKDIKKVFAGGLDGIWGFLAQPVWVMRKDKPAKEYSRGSLFALDVVRFGGTFASIFVALFVSLNYQSFFQIISPYLDPVERVSSLHGNVSEVDNALKEKLLKSPMLAVAGREEGDLLSYLPTVGPPENRIIVPRLGLNIPLVTPSYSSLLKEDWEGVETDIQDALKHGVVHYPGTARPGQAGNFFVTGHSSYYPWADGKYKTVFARLHELNVGDEYWVYYGGDKHRYVVQGKKEVKPSNVDVLDQPSNKRVATLMTCTPVGTTLRRLILTAQEVDPTTGIALQVGEREIRTSTGPAPAALPI
ncbi:MAG: sortase [Candidatus Peribacter sp.]|nr:sortase [Candidatus Peribacter sp.]MBT4600382.1 sortase [Candidatus Peribacter sp.]MBT5149340.1 sortase [Candidatus Peribacter sp.]MBT5637597.1 sortase [Candidatus Peribacter sp.]MBT5938099.1 sortase [Candidatus Peribacter sp.]